MGSIYRSTFSLPPQKIQSQLEGLDLASLQQQSRHPGEDDIQPKEGIQISPKLDSTLPTKIWLRLGPLRFSTIIIRPLGDEAEKGKQKKSRVKKCVDAKINRETKESELHSEFVIVKIREDQLRKGSKMAQDKETL